MFGTYLKSSLWVLPWLLIPVLCFAFFLFGIDPYYIQEYGTAANVEYFSWGRYAAQSIKVSLIIALVTQILLLLIVPSLVGGADGRIKRIEFYIGFFVNIALVFCVPLYFFITFGLDNTTFGILIGLHTVMFLATFILGSRFVSPAYKRAFWFAG